MKIFFSSFVSFYRDLKQERLLISPYVFLLEEEKIATRPYFDRIGRFFFFCNQEKNPLLYGNKRTLHCLSFCYQPRSPSFCSFIIIAASTQQFFCNLLLAALLQPPSSSPGMHASFHHLFYNCRFFFYFRMYVRHDSKLQTYLKVYEIGCIVCCRQIPYDLYVDHHQGLKLDAMFVVDRFHLIILLTVVSIAKPQLVCQLCL